MLICMFRKDGRVSGQEQELRCFSLRCFSSKSCGKNCTLLTTNKAAFSRVCKQRIGRNHVVTKSRALENMLVVARERYISDSK